MFSFPKVEMSIVVVNEQNFYEQFLNCSFEQTWKNDMNNVFIQHLNKKCWTKNVIKLTIYWTIVQWENKVNRWKINDTVENEI